MEDWKYLRKWSMVEKSGIFKGIGITILVLAAIGLIVCAVKCCYERKGSLCCGFDDFDDFVDDDDFEDEDE
jgi:hypothetical protein